jgi:signal peptidase I
VAAHQGSGQRATRPNLKDVLSVAGWTILAALFLKTFVIGAYRIPSRSMEGTLLPGDFLLANKILYGPATPRFFPLTPFRIPQVRLPSLLRPDRGDILVVELPARGDGSPSAASFDLVKRCIGVPGDTVAVVDGIVRVNGRIIPSLSAKNSAVPGTFGPAVVPARGEKLRLTPGTLPAWEGLIRSEGHSVTQDTSGSILVDGSPADRYTVERDYYFLLGDNLGDSFDSRKSGPVPRESIVGKVFLVYWSWDPGARGIFGRLGGVRWARIGTMVR